MRRVFNMGLGMLVVVKAADAETVLNHSILPSTIVGRIIERTEGAVEFV